MLPSSLLRLSLAASMRAFVLLAALVSLVVAGRAAPLNWAGTSYSLSPAANWVEAAAPSDTSDLVITKNGTTSGGSGTSNYLMGGNLTIRSITFDNATAQFNSANGARVITTNSSSSSASYTLTFATPGIDIITLTNNTNASFRSASIASNSTASPLPALTLDLNYAGTANLNIQDTSTLLISSGSYNTTEAKLSGTGGLVKTGTGSVTLSGNHTYAGGFTLQDGTVTVTTSGTVTNNAIVNSPFGTGELTIRGGTLIASSNTSRTVYGSVNLDGVATLTSTSNGTAGNYTISTLANGATTLLSNSTIVVPGPAYDTTNATNVGGQVTWNQSITGDFSLTKMGAGTLVLNTTSPFSGGLTVKEGLLRVDSTANLGKLPTTENADAVIFDGGSFEVTGSGFSSPNRGFRIAPNTSFAVDDGITVRIQGSIRDVAGKSGRLIKTGTGVLGLEPAAGMVYTYSGGTQVDAGTLRLLGATLGASGSPGVTLAAGTSLEGNGTIVGNVVLAATTLVSPATYGDIDPPNNTIGVTGVGTLTVNGNLDLSAVAATPGALAFDLDAPGTSDALAVTGGTLSLGSGVLGFASFQFNLLTNFAPGTYTLLTSATPISGTLAAANTGTLGAFPARLQLAAGNTALTLTVGDLPDIVTPPASATVTQGAAASFAVAATGSTLSYQWQKNGSDLVGATLATYSIASTSPADAGSYAVVVSNTTGAVTSASATLTVLVPAGIATQPIAQSVVTGTDVNLSVIASGTAPFTYQWQLDGNALAGATNATLTLTAATPANTGSYTVVVTNASGSVTSAAAVVTITTPITIIASPASDSVLTGHAVTLSVTAEGTAPLTYQWKKDDVALSGATNATFTLASAQTSDSALYTVVVTNAAGSVTSAAATLTVSDSVLAPAITTQPASQALYVGQTLNLSVSADGTRPLTYQWALGGADIAGATSATFTIATLAPTDAGSYTVKVANSAGDETSSAAVVTVDAPTAPTITTSPASQSVLVGADVTFTVVASGTAPFTYQWQKDGADISGATNATLALTNVALTASGSYLVVVTNLGGSAPSGAAVLTVQTLPTITAQPVPQTVTAGQSVTFTVVAGGTPAPTFQWLKDGVAISGATSANYTIATPTAADSGNYTVAVTNAAGTVTSSAGALTVNPSSYLANLSVRAAMGPGQTLIVGFVVSGGAKPVLVRSAGPALNAFGLTGVADPRIGLFDEHGTQVGANDDWDSALSPLFAQLGAFGFAAGSKDAALQQSINGPHTAQASGTGSASGTILVEGYDAGANDGRKLVNLSARYHVGTGSDILIVGFVVNGSGSKQVIIRAIGPTLAGFGVTGTLADPKLELYDGGTLIASNDNWDAALAPKFAALGAFPLEANSHDAAILVTVEAGKTYTAQISGVNNGTGEALVEVYDATP